MAYPYGYDPYYPYGLPVPAGRPRSHSHNRVEQNVFVPPQNVWVTPPERGRELYHHRSHSPTLAELEAQVAALKMDGMKSIDEKRRDEIISRYENEQAEKKRKDEAKLKEMKDKIKMQEIIDKDKKEAEWKAFEIERERRIAEEKAKKKKEEEKADEATRATLRKAGYSEGQVDRIMAMSKKDKDKVTSTTTTTTVAVAGGHHGRAGDIIIAGGIGGKPTYTRAKRSDIAPEILDRYGIGWRADDRDPHKYILVESSDTSLLEVLHEETKSRKKHGKKEILMIEEKKKHKEPGLAVVRKRRSKSRSRSRARSGERIILVRQ